MQALLSDIWKREPRGVTLLALLYWLVAGFTGLTGLLLLTGVSGIMGLEGGGTFQTRLPGAVVILMLALGCYALGLGIWRHRFKAYWVALILHTILLIGSTILATGGRADQVLPILLNTLIVVYLLRKKIKDVFDELSG